MNACCRLLAWLPLAIVAQLAACTARDGRGTDPAERPSDVAPTRSAVVRLHPQGRPAVDVGVELAMTEPERLRGLMFREQLAPDAGMLFVFPDARVQYFYMRNTYVPLDIVFISPERHVVGILRDMRPLDETSRSVGVPSQFALEVPARSCERWGLQPGDRVEFLGVAAAP